MVDSMQGDLRGGSHGRLGGAGRGRMVELAGHFKVSSHSSIVFALLPPRLPQVLALALALPAQGVPEGGALHGLWKMMMALQDGSMILKGVGLPSISD